MKIFTILFLLLTLGVFPFQACQKNLNFKSILDTNGDSKLNGEGYSGKPIIYDFLNQKQACLEKGANGNALPNSEIFIFPTGVAELVRENCVDIKPRPLGPQEYSIASNGDLVYQNQIFNSIINQDAFSVVAASCPAGKSLLPNPVRSSILQEPIDLQAKSWEHPGLAVNLVGSMGSLPLYEVKRNDPNALESWHRMAQSPLLAAGESYVFSFYVKPDAVEKALFVSYFANVHYVNIEFDLLTGAATVQSATGIKLISTKAQMFSGGLYISIYFQSLIDTSANMGIASAGQFLGSSISTTALQFEKISNFCAP
jgi:hypothetical protein